MNLRFGFWNSVLWEEDGGGGGGAAPAGGGEGQGNEAPAGGGEGQGDKGGTPPSNGKARNEASVSLRAQLAEILSEDERPTFTQWAEKHNDDASFVKDAMFMRSQFSSRAPVPGKDAKPEEFSKYFERVGKPRNAKDYKFDFGKDENDKPIELDDTERGFFEAFKEHSHATHKTQGQFEADLKFFQEFEQKRESQFMAHLDRAQDQVISELKEKWGPDFAANVEAAKAGGEVFADDPAAWREFVNLPLAGGMRVGDHPTFLTTMAKIGRASGEDQRVRNLKASGEADSINDQIRAIEQEAFEKGHSTSQEPYHSKLDALYKKLYPQVMQGSQGTGFGA